MATISSPVIVAKLNLAHTTRPTTVFSSSSSLFFGDIVKNWACLHLVVNRSRRASTSEKSGLSCNYLFGVRVPELVVIVSVATLVFGPTKLPKVGRSIGKTVKSFQQEVDKLGEGLLKKPESIAVDNMGVLYTASRDGWIRRLYRNGSWDNWRHIDSDTLLGIATTAAGDLVVCDSEKGLLKVGEDGVTVLASHVNDVKISFADDVIESADGNLYFSIASTKFSLHDWHLDVLEAKPHGQLLTYNPSSKQTTILLDNLAFANGVTLSADQDFLIICETWKFRCLKYWLKEEKMGQTEIFVDDLPGGPDNINLAPDGSFWIALLQLVPNGLEFVHRSRKLKHILMCFPKLSKWVIGVNNKATVINVASDGKIIRSFDDPTGKVMSFVTSALEFENHLYLGTLNCDFVGKLQLTTS